MTEVLQEILHRYVAIDRRDASSLRLDALLGVVDQVLVVDARVVQRAKKHCSRISTDCQPATQCIFPSWNRMESSQILSFDSGFDVFLESRVYRDRLPRPVFHW